MTYYRLILDEHPGDELAINFLCQADDKEHAEQQCRDMYPDCIIHLTEVSNSQ